MIAGGGGAPRTSSGAALARLAINRRAAQNADRLMNCILIVSRTAYIEW